jgi:hypothetical protein
MEDCWGQLQSTEQTAPRLVGEILAKAGWKDWDLTSLRKGDRVKVRIAKRLRAQTTMLWKLIAERLSMGHSRSAANAVRQAKFK